MLSPLGAGGMGEVYRARDTVLGRDVALKTLPDDLARHPQRLARLKREARILASLNHPGIATLFGVEERDGTPVLAMEVVEGETLSDRLRRGPLPLKDTLRIGQQVAEAVAAAHEQGVLHRDLKPANIRLTRDSRAKVLDFGLARSLEDHEPSLDSTDETLSSPASRSGAVMGTAPYMSPEQARAQEVDERTDVWGFGCVLYEMLTGRRAFPGATFSEVSAAILERDPDYAALPESTPLVLVRLLRRCLRRDQGERLRDIADAGLELRELLQEVTSGASVVTVGSGWSGDGTSGTGARPRTRAIGAVGVLIVGVGGIGMLLSHRGGTSPNEGRQPRFEITLPQGVGVVPVGASTNPVALSPNGQLLAFVGCGAGVCQLYVRDWSEVGARPLPGTEGARAPFFSPDGRWIAFGATGKLKKVSVADGAVITLADAPQFRGGAWGSDGTILFSPGRSGLFLVAGDGGDARQLTKLDPGRHDIDHRWPHHLPDGRTALLDIVSEGFTNDVAVVDLASGQTRVLVPNAGSPRWSPSGHVLFGRLGIVYAAPFDVRRSMLTGPARPVLEGVAMWNSPGIDYAGGNVYYALSPEGTLVFCPREARLPKRTLVWVDREGRRTPLTTRQRSYGRKPHLSPDGTRVAVGVEVGPGPRRDLVVFDIRRDTWTKVALPDERSLDEMAIAAWMPDGTHLLAQVRSQARLQLLLLAVDGPEPAVELLSGEAQFVAPTPDGRALLFCSQPAPSQHDIWRLPLDGRYRAEPFLVGPALEVAPSFHPGGRFVAYRSDDSGRPEVYVRPYPGPGPRRIVSTQTGNIPIWSRTGREIFFPSRGAMTSVAVRTTPTLAFEPPRRLFALAEEIARDSDFYDVTPDGQRFLMIEKDPFELRPLGLVIVPNWTAELKARLAAAGMRN